MTEPAGRGRDVARRVVAPLCPVLLALFPLLSLFAQNDSEVELSLLWLPLAVTLAVAVASFGILLLLTRNASKAGVLASVLVVGFFYYGIFSGRAASAGLGGNRYLVLWLALVVVAFVAGLVTTRSLGNLTYVVAVAAAVMTLPQGASVVLYQVNHRSLSAADPRLWPTRLARPSPPAGARLPDIYVIVPDDYARPDVLRQYFHFDDASFLRGLRRRGFVVSQRGRSPYSDSESNIAALLNMDYLRAFPTVLGRRSQDVRPVKRVIEDSRARRLLRSAGYRYVHLDTDEVTFAGGNPGISALAPPDSFANLWLRKTVLARVGGRLGFSERARDTRYRSSIRSVFAQLRAVPAQAGPKFVVFHTLLPHDPYVFGAAGGPVTFPGRTDDSLASTTGRAYYLQQLRYVNTQLLAAIDAILAHARRPPVIVLQSDEGFQANAQPFGEAAMLDIRVKGLAAFYLPGRGAPRVPQPANTVNDLRFVFNRYLGTHYRLLRSASYPEGDLPYVYNELRVR